MGAIAGANLQVLTMTSMEHDLQAQLSHYNDIKMMLSAQSIFVGEEKSKFFNSLSGSGTQYTMDQQKALGKIEQKERYLQNYEKQIDMKIQQIQTKLTEVQERKKAEQQRLQQNMQNAFSYGLGGGR